MSDINTPTRDSDGRFLRAESQMRSWVTADGAPGPSGIGGFKAEPDRYHLYVALNCPWAHRSLIFRKIKGLEKLISLSVVMPQRTDQGWAFGEYPGCIPDTVNGYSHLRDLYFATDPDYADRFTVPVLWDKQQSVVVNNESSEIIRMFNSAFDEHTDEETDYYPDRLRSEIDEINDFVYERVNNGVYRAGFATTQQAYEEGYAMVFDALDTLEERLSSQRFLVGDQITEADWRIFPTLIRFEFSYHGAFRCNKRRLVDYENLWGYTLDLYQTPGVASTVNVDHIKAGYWRQGDRNPSGIIPKGPWVDLDAPHGRANA
jgi:putative glutathione S-transferase